MVSQARRLSQIAAVLGLFITITDGARFLALFPLPRESHFAMYEKLMKGLVNNGHEVDVVSYFPQKIKLPRYYDISLGNKSEMKKFDLPVSVVQNYNVWAVATYVFTNYGSDMCEKLFENPDVAKLRRMHKKYDMIIAELYGSDCFLGFADHFNAPIVGILGDEITPWASDRMGNPDNPSYMPNYLLPYESQMSLQKRALNALSDVLYKVGYQFMSLHSSELKSRKFFGAETTALDILAYNTSLLLTNTHFSINYARPFVPGIIEVAGLHIDSPQRLPPDLGKFINDNGKFVYVVINLEDMTEAKIKDVLSAMKNLSSPIIIRGSASRFGGQTMPKNIFYDELKASTTDVLCDPQSGLVVTHGDIFILQEAVHCAVPVVGLPLTAEHEVNIQRYVHKGLALKVNYDDLQPNAVAEAVGSILNNLTYKRNAEKLSVIFRDRPMKPLDTAIFWIEYVLRHAGASHLRTVGADLIWMEYYNVDVAIVYVGIVLLVLGIMYLTIVSFDKLKAMRQHQNLKKMN